MYKALVCAHICSVGALQSEQSCRQQKLQILSEALKVNIIISALFCASTVLLQFSLLHWNASATVDVLKKENASSWNAEIDNNKPPDDTYFIKEILLQLVVFVLFPKCSLHPGMCCSSVQLPLWAGSFRHSFTGTNTLFRRLQMPELVSFSSCSGILLWGCLCFFFNLSPILRFHSTQYALRIQSCAYKHIHFLSFFILDLLFFVFPFLPNPSCAPSHKNLPLSHIYPNRGEY